MNIRKLVNSTGSSEYRTRVSSKEATSHNKLTGQQSKAEEYVQFRTGEGNEADEEGRECSHDLIGNRCWRSGRSASLRLGQRN